MAGVMFVLAIFQQWLPAELGYHIERYFQRLASYVYPYITIIFNEYQVDDFERSVAYMAIERYLSAHSSNGAKRLKANVLRDGKSVFLSMDDYEEVTDEFKGIKIWWSSSKSVPQQNVLIASREDDHEKRYFKLTCHRKDRDVITKLYVHHVIDEGKAIAAKTRQRWLFTNNKRNSWSGIIFEHPSTFDTLAMDPQKKKDILEDIMTFRNSKDYYTKVGKSWKRGYLLYGPPGTGKSSMIAAMANLLEYDIYDLELTSVQDNTDLRKLLIRTSITLSGLLNFIDGLWSACGSERLIVFTTNHIEKLDPALIRRGRMDMHIELSYCCFETFKILAKNYLDLESHELFATIGRLLEETSMSPADVAENLMSKSATRNVESRLNNLIKALENRKKEVRLKVEEETPNISQQDGESVQESDDDTSDAESSDAGTSDAESSHAESSDSDG
ncbi:ATPase, AAA-type, core [Artemisia annua]|uniref:ATPase, AAA-type, core n=1 Tax=Artemisia annua TaxID=35608 RepID=A0A2U1Q4X7_ARTAN|nr:ATPase, AAA-type, core [Artemisia annua]